MLIASTGELEQYLSVFQYRMVRNTHVLIEALDEAGLYQQEHDKDERYVIGEGLTGTADSLLWSHPRTMDRIRMRKGKRVKHVILLLNRVTDTEDDGGLGDGGGGSRASSREPGTVCGSLSFHPGSWSSWVSCQRTGP